MQDFGTPKGLFFTMQHWYHFAKNAASCISFVSHFIFYPLQLMLSSLQFTFSLYRLFCFAADLEQSRAEQGSGYHGLRFSPLTCHPLPCPLVSPLVSRREREMTSAIDASARADGAATKMVVT